MADRPPMSPISNRAGRNIPDGGEILLYKRAREKDEPSVKVPRSRSALATTRDSLDTI